MPREEPSPGPPDLPGTYVLVLDVARERLVRVGRLGVFPVAAGTWLYVGSAFGPGGLAARVGRHLRSRKPARWHVDHLRRAARVDAVLFTTDPARRECEWAAALAGWPGASLPIPGFGSSGCSCPAHLIFLAGEPDLDGLRARLGRGGAEVGVWRV